MPNAFLTGQAIYLRPLELGDAPLLAQWFNDPEFIRTLRRYLPMTLLEEEAFLRKLAENEDPVIFGIGIGEKNCWGQGYGTEATRLVVDYAFRTLNLNRVSLEVYEYNPRGLHVYEKVGFRLEGRLRQDTFRDGRYWDTLILGILREEWMSAAGQASAST
jgi:RimJ/RimL family protein N-acetyltransferase